MKAKEFNEMYSEIHDVIKRGVVDICPSCGEITEVHPNPYYYHECEHCKWRGSYTLCDDKDPKEFVREILIKYGLKIDGKE